MRQKREQIPARTLLLAVEDPETRVGSGGATLNALLVAAEHLSARAGFTVSAHDVLSSATGPGPNRDGGSRQIVSRVTSSLGSITWPVQLLVPISVPIDWTDSSGGVEVRAGLSSAFRTSEPVPQN